MRPGTSGSGRWSQRLRDALLAHRHGARLIRVACGPDPHSVRYAEAVVSTLTEAGFDGRRASRAHWTIFYLILGIAQEQQVARDSTAITANQVPTDRYPALAATLSRVGPGDFDQRFASASA
ncbi:TetR/AcrR family transcriptional regulator C-terminal domain-containing protein [Micromonospora krabiensis]|uniref:Tetracyclin repressor, C-terminal all-alpha domain n=1 Tax=Micromonospora krabiensis TaxID=307121 RepID=A0A1C3MWM4_9ACTN|nr:TetR/AcrR family transcriptional regulator C-terminal domain-containing protein [Micromonospora krabiensis]SBV24720.1 Tetracyclin repressor, C-terminal all-alpha domain [Micromonospora krabiensis]